MGTPYLNIDIGKIEHNARTVVSLCAGCGIEVTGVTKGVCGHPEVARAMLRGGVSSIGDSRLINIRRLRAAGMGDGLMLLRIPSLSQVGEVAASVSISLNSELAVLTRLSEHALRSRRRHPVMIMVDLGDLREGVQPEDLVPFCRQAAALPGILIKGLGTNLSCFAGVMPDAANMNRFVELANAVEENCRMRLDWLSGVNSSGLDLIASGRMPERVNHGRIGEAILLGRETIERRPWPGAHQDAFVLYAEVLECRRKPSMPVGTRSEDAFGGRLELADRGERLRALVNVGREDVDIAGLTPLERNIDIIGGSSGYLVLDVTAAAEAVEVGSVLAFAPGYGALLRAMTSEYVEKQCL